jgi:Lipase (class 3)
VEWVRTCFSSSWRLFVNQPGVYTRGRYVRCPPGTPCLPFPSSLGSRDWTSDERDPWPLLGEVEGNVRRYNDGSQHGPPALPVLVGNRDCIQYGESVYPPFPLVTLEDGWDSRCPRRVAPVPSGTPVVDIFDCHFQQWAAQCMQAVYDMSLGDVGAVVAARYPLAQISTFFNTLNGPTPSHVVIVIGQTTIVVVAGTDPLLQWFGQIISSLLPLRDNGQYATLLLWVAASTVVLNTLSLASSNISGQLVFVGHSFGGALANLCAVQTKQAIPARRVGVLTFGCPKTGDERLVMLLRTVEQLHLVADGDLVPYLPPSGTTAAVINWLLPTPFRLTTGPFQWMELSQLLLESGQRRYIPSENVPFASIAEMIVVWLASPSPPAVQWQHFLTNYMRLITCGTPPPFPPLIGSGGGMGDGHALAGSGVRSAGGGMGDGHALAGHGVRSAGGGMGDGHALAGGVSYILMEDGSLVLLEDGTGIFTE